MSTSPLPDHAPPDHARPDHARSSGYPTDETAHLAVTDVARSLDFYLDLGCEVRSAADGWVLLHRAHTAFLLTAATPGPDWRARAQPRRRPTMPTPPIRLSTPDLRALRRRLRATGIPAGPITRPPHAPAGEIEVTDPDQHLVVIEQL